MPALPGGGRELLSLFNRDVAHAARADVFGAGAYEAVVGVLFEYVARPAGDSADGEDGREEVKGDSELVVDRARVVIDVRVELLRGEQQRAQAFEDFEPARLAPLLAHLLREAAQPDRARVFGLVNPVAEADDLLLLRECVLQPLLRLVRRAYLKEHLHHVSVRAAVERPRERGYRARHGAVHVGERARDDARRERGRVQLVVCVEYEAHVEYARLALGR